MLLLLLLMWLMLLPLALLLLLPPGPMLASVSLGTFPASVDNNDCCNRCCCSSSCCFRNLMQGTHSVRTCSRIRVSALVSYSCVQLATMARFSRCCCVRYGFGWPSGLRAPQRLHIKQIVQCHRPVKPKLYVIDID